MCAEKEKIYQDAVALCSDTFRTDKLTDARDTFLSLGDYKDAAKYAERCEKYLKWQKGSVLEFGSLDGKPLTWRILDAEGHKRLLFCDSIVARIPYNEERNNKNWSQCSLRHWLNKDFLEEAFPLRERMSILLINHVNNVDPRWSIENGPDTRDKAFIFTNQELDEYHLTTEECSLGEWWWLRGLGKKDTLAPMAVTPDGTVYESGINKNSENVGVRPAIWVRVTF